MTTPNDAAAGTNNGNGAAGDAGSGNAGTQGTAGSAGTVDNAQAGNTPAQNASDANKVVQDERYGTPEKGYEVPESLAAFDDQFKSDLGALGKELNLSAKGMEKVYALAAKRAQTTDQAFKTAHEQNLKSWEASVTADKELGGEQLAASQATAQKGLEHFGTPELKQILTESGLDKHPEFRRFFYRVGKAVGEDKFVKGGASQNGASNSGLFTYEKSDHAA